MITLTTEQAQQIEEALVTFTSVYFEERHRKVATKALAATREAKAQGQAEQEPCIECGRPTMSAESKCDDCHSMDDAAPVQQVEQEPVGVVTKDSLDGVVKWNGWIPREGTKLYAAPVRTKDLTDDEILKVWNTTTAPLVHCLRAVIAADRELNK